MISPPVAYFKRFRMEIDLLAPLPAPQIDLGYTLLAWRETLLDAHAEVKYLSFIDEVDAVVFPSLSNRVGCRNLMKEIVGKAGFMPSATWLIQSPDGYCGTVQGVRNRHGWGAIQNLGVTAEHRGRGVGCALLLSALAGFQHAGLKRAVLEVTAENESAIRLYRRVGFRCRKTIYKAVETLVEPEPAII